MTILREYREAQQRLIARVRELEPLVAEYHELHAELERMNLTDALTEKPKTPVEGTATTKAPRQRRRQTAATSRSRAAKPVSAKRAAAATAPLKTAVPTTGKSQGPGARTAKSKASRTASRSRAKTPGASRAPKGGRAEQIANLVAQNPGLTIKDLGTQLGVDPTGLYQPVRKLIAAGTIRKDGSQLHTAS